MSNKKPYDITYIDGAMVKFIQEEFWAIKRKNKKYTRLQHTNYVNRKLGLNKSYDTICRVLRGEYDDRISHTKKLKVVTPTQLTFNFDEPTPPSVA